MKKRYLILEDGTIFQGYGFGAEADAIGELVFTTSVVGYVETLTDPSFCGQIVMQTFPLIGNYGMMEEDFEGKPWLHGYVVKEWCEDPSNFRCDYDLDCFLKKHGIPGLYGVDTRELTNRIREYGVVNAMILDGMPEDMSEISSYAVRGAVSRVTSGECWECLPEGEEKHHVALIDYGVKRSLLRSLSARGCRVTVMPADSTAEDVLAAAPEGVMLSGGPGDPQENAAYVETIHQLMGKIPVFGTGLGHQLLALANGGKIVKLKYGHRGGNQPCRQMGGTRTYITCQNHGYAVAADSVPNGIQSFVNANDGTCEGMDYPQLQAFSVQFDPEACGGVTDTGFLFDRFISMMEGK